MSRILEIFTDGACRGNPGEASIGVVVYEHKKIIKEISKSIGLATNNIAEYQALICALKEALSLKADQIKIFTDSELMYCQIKGEYRVKDIKLKPLFLEAQELIKQFRSFEISHVPREENKLADRLAAAVLENSLLAGK